MYNFAVIFDMDGVMINNNHYHKKAWKTFCEKHNFNLSDEDLKQHVYGKINSEILAYLFGKELDDKKIKEYGEEKETIYREIYKEHIKPVKGLIDFLDILKKENIKRAIATSAYPKNVEFVLKSIAAKKYFDTIIDDSQVTKGKPNPQVYLITSKELSMGAKDCIVLEDSLSGIESAKRAGMKVIAITTTHTKEELSHADMVIDDFTELDVDVLQALF